MNEKFFSELKKITNDFYRCSDTEKISPIIMVNKITQLMINSHGSEDFDNITDTISRDSIFDSIDRLYKDFTPEKATNDYIKSYPYFDRIDFQNSERKALKQLTKNEKYQIVFDAFNEVLKADPNFDLFFYHSSENINILDGKILEIIRAKNYIK